MNSPVFSKSDFILCDVPVPDGYPQSQTHVGVAFWGRKLFLTCSPYPVKKSSRLCAYWRKIEQKITHGLLGRSINAESFENPLLYVATFVGNNPPVVFEPVRPFPLMDTPYPVFGQPAYNSDPDIYIDNDSVYIINRTYYRKPLTNGKVEKEVLISLIRGSLSELGYQFVGIEDFKRSPNSLISPCLTKFHGEYLFTQLETNSALDGHTFGGLFIQRAKNIDGLREEVYSKVEIEGGDMLPWHMSLFIYNDELYAIIACVKEGDASHLWQMMGKFNADLSALQIYPHPLTDYNSYRGSAIVVDDEFILYSTTLNDKVKGSNAVDGRDIIMAKLPMEEALKRVGGPI